MATERAFIQALLARTRAARMSTGLSLQEFAVALSDKSGRAVTKDTYKEYERRSPLPHFLIGPFCELTGQGVAQFVTGSHELVSRAAKQRLRSV